MSSLIYQEKSVSIKVPEESTTQGPTKKQTEGIPTDMQIWGATLTIEDMEFVDELSKPSSEAFKTLERDLTKLLQGIFGSIRGFLYTKVDSFKNGSIVCQFSIFTKVGSSSHEEYEEALIAASEKGETGKFKIGKIEVYDRLSVGASKDEKPQNDFQPLKVIGITIFATAVVMVVLFFVVRVSFYLSISWTTRLKEGVASYPIHRSPPAHAPLDQPLSRCIAS